MQAYERLEREWGEWAGAPNVVACASGTAALHLALEALELPLGSRIICPDYAMVAIPRAIVAAGHRPVFADCRCHDLNIDPALVASAIAGNPCISAVVVQHTYGRPCDMDAIHASAGGRPVIEDLAEAHCQRPDLRSAAWCWSFYRNKVVHGEEGGAVAFRKFNHAEVARILRCLGFGNVDPYDHRPRGWNHRMSNAHAELVLASLARVDEEVARRRQVEAEYDAACPPAWRMPPRVTPWVYDLRLPLTDKTRKPLNIAGLINAEYKIAARPSFRPVSGLLEFAVADVRCGEHASKSVLYLPLDAMPVDAPGIFRLIQDHL